MRAADHRSDALITNAKRSTGKMPQCHKLTLSSIRTRGAIANCGLGLAPRWKLK